MRTIVSSLTQCKTVLLIVGPTGRSLVLDVNHIEGQVVDLLIRVGGIKAE